MSDTSYTEYLVRKQRATDIEQARVRGWAYFLGAYLTGPISVSYTHLTLPTTD